MDFDFDFSDDFDSIGSLGDIGSSFVDSLPSLGDAAMAGTSWYDPTSWLTSLGESGYTPSYDASSFRDFQADPYMSPSLSASESSSLLSPSFLTQADDTLQSVGKYLGTPGGKLVMSLGGGALSAFDAMKKQALMKKAQKQYQQQLAARQAKAQAYDAPLRLAFERTKSATPQVGAGGSEAQFFTGNKLPSYYAGGGSVDEPGVLGFIKYMIAGKRLPSEIREAEEAKRRALQESREGTMMEGAAKLGDRRRQLEEMEKSQGLARGGSPRYVSGGSPGQSDKVPAMLSDGEYVWDADTVSALGDGNNAAGAAALDKARERIRAHKRSAPVNKIPPKARAPLSYIKKEKTHG